MKILVIIVTYNAMQWAERCFNSLRKSTVKPDVYVVDNGSTDGTQAYIQKHYPEVMFQQSEKNLGFGKANNLGLQYALDHDYDYVYLLNQDAWVFPETFESLINVSKRNPEYGVLSPIQLKANEINMDEKFVHNTIRNHQKTSPLLVEDLFFGRKRDLYEVSFVMAAHWLITRKCLETVGGFSHSFPHYGEDGDYINRLLYWNLKCGIVPSSCAIHDRSDPNWNEEKNLYMDYYINPLVLLSDPTRKTNFYSTIIYYLIYLLKNHKAKAIKHIVSLIRERRTIFLNLNISKELRAFIK